ncbi:GTPase Der [uncultured Gammaproteobacteria bacterium]
MLSLVIVGRPNVGKSTLFNRLAGKRLALVDATPGVTRDWRSAPGRVGGIEFTVIDTAGLEEVFDGSLEARMRRQTERALAEADVCLFLIDARTGLTPLDRHFSLWLRRQPTPVVLVANKCEGREGMPGLYEAYELGLGDPVPLSAEHGEGLADLVEALLPYMPPEPTTKAEPGGAVAEVRAWGGFDGGAVGEDDEEEEPLDYETKPLALAIVGRPNVGKSTLLNALVGQERVLTGPEPGMTRDAITVEWQWHGRRLRLVDTAGLRRQARIEEKLEKLATADTLRVLRMAEVVILVLDAEAILDKQDLNIARHVLEEGRALVVAVNKWDTVTNRTEALARLSDRLEASLPQARGIPTVTVSALHGRNLDELCEAVFGAHQTWNRRVSTSRLNRWLEGVLEHHPPPLVHGRRIKIRYMTQVKARPPTFALWLNKPADLPESYLRYLIGGLREAFDLPGVPLRLLQRKGDNPYAKGPKR